jgi:ribonuclease HII
MRQSPDLSLELPLWEAGLLTLAGLDEAGRGAWAGPVAAGAVILPADAAILERLSGVRDSKQMTPLQRARWAEQIQAAALSWGVGFASSLEIDAIGIVPATRLAMQRALDGMVVRPVHLLIDALNLPEEELPQTYLPKGDARSLSIAAASVIAKTQRDALMVALDEHYPAYGFARHKGYGTRRHQVSLGQWGPCAIHRASFAPVRDWRTGDDLATRSR